MKRFLRKSEECTIGLDIQWSENSQSAIAFGEITRTSNCALVDYKNINNIIFAREYGYMIR